MALYISASASDGNCQVIDHSINLCRNRRKKVLRLRELLLALEYYDGCLEVVETSSSSSPSASASASGEQVQASSNTTEGQTSTIPADSPSMKEGVDELIAGENGDIPEDIPDDSTDDLTAC